MRIASSSGIDRESLSTLQSFKRIASSSGMMTGTTLAGSCSHSKERSATPVRWPGLHEHFVALHNNGQLLFNRLEHFVSSVSVSKVCDPKWTWSWKVTLLPWILSLDLSGLCRELTRLGVRRSYRLRQWVLNVAVGIWTRLNEPWIDAFRGTAIV